MRPEILGILIPIIALCGAFTLILTKMLLDHRKTVFRISDGAKQQEVERLADAVDNLRSEVGLLSEEFREINERMDFTERLLERPKTEG